MIQTQKDKIFMEQIGEANPEVRGALNQMMKNNEKLTDEESPKKK